MTQSTAAHGKPAGLGRYRFRETLSTSFFGPRFRVEYDGTPANSDAPPDLNGEQRSTLRPRSDMPLALRLIEVDAPNLLERVARAVQAVREVDHRAVLRPLQIVRASTRLGIVTPDIEGVTLARLLHDASFREDDLIPPSIALRIVMDILNGLQALSDQGPSGRRREWGYGGVTPDSIHVGLDGQTRYLDPGVASAAARQPCWSHEAAALAYTAPEQTGADANFDATSDNFSVGVMLWELLTCRPLFGASTAAETLERVHLAPIPRVQRQQFVRGEPIVSALAQAVSQALRRDAKLRFSSYDDFANALDSAGEPGARSAVGDLVRMSLPDAPHALAAQRSQPSPTRVSLAAVANDQLRAEPPPLTAARSDRDASASHPTHAGIDMNVEHLPTPANDSFWPASASWVPETSETRTPFPVGDLAREPASRHRVAWTWGLACAAVALLGVVAWQTSTRTAATRAAATQPAPAVAPATVLDAVSAPPNDAARAVAQTPVPVPLTIADKPATAPASPTAQSPAARVTIKAVKAQAGRRVSAHAKTTAPTRDKVKAESAPFIPNDI